MGDFNRDLEQLQRLSRDWPGIFQISKNAGDLPTVRRVGGQTVDHVCLRGCETVLEALPCSRVLRDWDISDHYPVVNCLPAMRRCPQQVPTGTAERATLSKRIRVPTRGTEMDLIADNNRWLVLALEDDETDDEADVKSAVNSAGEPDQASQASAGGAGDSGAEGTGGAGDSKAEGSGGARDTGADTDTGRAGSGASAEFPLSQAAALTKLNLKAATLKRTCHAVAADLELHNSPRPAGPSVVPTRLRRAINKRRKAWRTVLNLLDDPATADAELAEAKASHLACTK
jgi:hypothetical protein